MRLKPVNDKIVVKPTETEELKTTEAGIILPDTAADGGLLEGTVVAVGEGMYSAQRQVVDGKLKIDASSVIQNNYKLQLLEMLSNGSKLNDIRKLIADNSVSDYSELYRLLYDEVDNYGNGKQAECIMNIAEAQFQDVNVVDKEINFMSLIIRLMRVIK